MRRPTGFVKRNHLNLARARGIDRAHRCATGKRDSLVEHPRERVNGRTGGRGMSEQQRPRAEGGSRTLSRAESAFIAPTSRLLMGRSKTGRNNPRPPRSPSDGDVGRGFREGNEPEGLPSTPVADDNTLRFGALSASVRDRLRGSNPYGVDCGFSEPRDGRDAFSV